MKPWLAGCLLAATVAPFSGAVPADGAGKAPEPRWSCAWPDPATGAPLAIPFSADALVVIRPGHTATLECLGEGGRPARFCVLPDTDAGQAAAPSDGWMARLAVRMPAEGQPVLRRMRLEFQDHPARPVTVWFLPPVDARAGADGFGMLRAGGLEIGQYRSPSASGTPKVKNNPADYRPPALFMVMPPEAMEAELAPGFRLGDWVVPSEGSGARHTRAAPVNYRLWQSVGTVRRALAARGVAPGALRIISGYRAPAYNRGAGSGWYGRHAYGDAVDFYLDTRGDGRTGDLDGDGRVDRRDALWTIGLLEELMADGHIPTGGLGAYTFTGGKRVTWHYDQRGHRATWGFHTDAAGKRTEFSWQSRRFAELDRREEREARERARQEGRPYSPPRREPLP